LKYFSPLVDEQTATRRFGRRPLVRLLQRFGAGIGRLAVRHPESPSLPSSGSERTVPFAELVFLPYYLITFDASVKGASHPVDTLVGGCDAEFAWVDLSHARFESRPDQERFPPAIDDVHAEQIARSALMSSILRSPGWRGKPVIRQARSVEIVQYPFWVYYFERRRGLLDIKVLDAVSGKRPGTKLKAALLGALVDAARRRHTQSLPPT
jgi:hypothetical protein